MRGRLPKAWALVVALMLVVTSCSSDESGGDEDRSRPEATPASPSGPAVRALDPLTEADLVEALARGGIETFADAGDSGPVVPAEDPGPMVLTGWQVETMQRQLETGRGYRGRDLDALTADVADGVPTSVVLAAWISAADTRAADVARELMGERDYAHLALDLTYPDAVVALFVNDLARSDGGPAASPSASPAAYVVRSAPAGICSDMVNLLSGSLDSIVQSLQVQVTSGAAGVLASIWNTVVSFAASAAKIALGAFTSALIAPVTRAITLVAVLTEAASLLDPWAIDTTVAPADSLPPDTDAVVTTDVNAALDFEWPVDLKDCASTLTGVTLPDPGETQGSPVTWDYQDPYVTTALSSQDAVLDEAGTARLGLTTLPQDPSELTGSPVAYPVLVRTDVERTQVKKLTDLIRDLLLGALPAPARAIVDALLGPATSAAQAQLAALVSAKGKAREIQTIRFQKSPDPVPPPAPADDCVGAAQTTVPDGTWKGPIDLAVTGKGLTGQAFSGGRGTLSMVVADGKVTSGRWAVAWRSKGVSSEGGMTTRIVIQGQIRGSVEGAASVPFLKGRWRILGTATVDVVGTIPLDFSGKDTEDMRIEGTSCDEVTGTFLPSFNAKGSPATFSGTARWTGGRVS